ncbi:MAG: alpha/beta fold hydrolase [Bacteroidaceae bacterium]|nr:alpha/beta fold hydrolase [Bacteroidaceae bacterium]
MKRTTLFISTFTVLLFTSCAQKNVPPKHSDIPENWAGEATIGANKLKIGFSINTSPDGKQAGTMDVPEQGAKGIPVEIIKNDTDSISLAIPTLKATYKGCKNSKESIKGIFTQHGAALPLNLKPGTAELKRPQTPVAPFAYTTEEVLFRSETNGAELSGTLTYPVNYKKQKKGSVPVVLMVTGSGSQDRNEDIYNHKPFLVIADYLAKNGIASLRYDDRGVGKSKGSAKGTTKENFKDATAGISFLRSLGKFGKTGVLGHSEGGTIAFMMGAEKSVDFIVSLAGSAANGIDVIVGQNEAMMQLQGAPQKLAKEYGTAARIVYNDRIKGIEIVNKSQYINELCASNNLSLPENLKANLAKCITLGDEWLTWFLAYNPAEDIRKISCPTMAINGSMDMQVLSKDNLPVIKENLPKNEKNLIKEYNALNHLFQHCTPATALNYGAIEETISQEVLNDIANWINNIR